MVKVGKQDVRYAMTQIIDREMKKQQEAEIKEEMEKLYKESYSEFCPYCKQIATIDGSAETSRIENIRGKQYLTGKCQHCHKELYVRVVMQPPKSMLDRPSSRGYFYTKEQVHGLPAEPVKLQGKPILTGSIWKESKD